MYSAHLINIPAHRIVLAARSPYFQKLFCGEWRDGSDPVARFEDFTENAMREVLRYIYTGKLKVDISSVMGVLKISSYLGLDRLMSDCKKYLLNGYLNAFDLCILYCEVRHESEDFEDMRQFLTSIIPDKVETDILCKVLKELWVTPDPNQHLYSSIADLEKEFVGLEKGSSHSFLLTESRNACQKS